MSVIFEACAEKKFLSFTKSVQIQILKYVKRIESLDSPTDLGKALKGNLKGFWRYRVGDYRLICKIEGFAQNSKVIVVDINHRSKVYQ